VGIEDLGPKALESPTPVSITSVCSVYAETEVLYWVYEEKELSDIACGINRAMADRVKGLVKRVGIEENVCITGGVAKNVSVVKNLEDMLQIQSQKLDIDPQIVGALGACLFAKEKLLKQENKQFGEKVV